MIVEQPGNGEGHKGPRGISRENRASGQSHVSTTTRPAAPELCSLCNQPGSFENPITHSKWGLSFVSEPFPAHHSCISDFLWDRRKDAS